MCLIFRALIQREVPKCNGAGLVELERLGELFRFGGCVDRLSLVHFVHFVRDIRIMLFESSPAITPHKCIGILLQVTDSVHEPLFN